MWSLASLSAVSGAAPEIQSQVDLTRKSTSDGGGMGVASRRRWGGHAVHQPSDSNKAKTKMGGAGDDNIITFNSATRSARRHCCLRRDPDIVRRCRREDADG